MKNSIFKITGLNKISIFCIVIFSFAAIAPFALCQTMKWNDPALIERSKAVKKLAEKGNPEAQFTLGTMYHVGSGVQQNIEEAFRWYLVSANKGYAPAQNAVGGMHDFGQGAPQDDVLAVYWYREAAAQGFAPGQDNLGYMYSAGRGVPKDYKEALKWFERAAAQGFDQGINNLAWLLSTCPDNSIRNGQRALTLLKPLVDKGNKEPAVIDTLAAAYAELGMFDKAISLMREAIQKLEQPAAAEQIKRFQTRLKSYENGKPWRE